MTKTMDKPNAGLSIEDILAEFPGSTVVESFEKLPALFFQTPKDAKGKNPARAFQPGQLIQGVILDVRRNVETENEYAKTDADKIILKDVYTIKLDRHSAYVGKGKSETAPEVKAGDRVAFWAQSGARYMLAKLPMGCRFAIAYLGKGEDGYHDFKVVNLGAGN